MKQKLRLQIQAFLVFLNNLLLKKEPAENVLITETSERKVSKPLIMGIMDTFTLNCFSPEFNIITPTPENWISELESNQVEALFIESAWHGNEDSWLYQVGKYNNQNNRKLRELVTLIRSKNIPVIFWNKEDPVHFEHFLVAAELADYVFTTDSDCIPLYINKLEHENVFALPFAAQPQIHNPVRTTARDRTVCFAGTYHNDRYKERKSDLEFLLKPALKYGLEIYDRNFNPNGTQNPKYRFPELYQSAIKGKLEYIDMVNAYKQFKVFLNVNSVTNSPTMFSRRVFELLASGTPVISSYSKGIADIIGDDIVLISESENDTTNYLEKLLNDEYYWWGLSLRGLRKIHEFHTYSHRVQEIIKYTDLKPAIRNKVSFMIVAHIPVLDQTDFFRDFIINQSFRDFDILLISNNISIHSEIIDSLRTGINDQHRIEVIGSENRFQAEKIWNSFSNTHIALISNLHFYGKNYLRDYAIAINYSGAHALGKKSHLKKVGINDSMIVNKGYEYSYTNEVPCGSLVIEKNKIDLTQTLNITTLDSYAISEETIFSIDPFNFILDGRFIQTSIQIKAEI